MRTRNQANSERRRGGAGLSRISFLLLAVLLPSAMRGGESVAAEESLVVERSVARLAERASRMIPRHEYDAALDTIYQALDIDPSYVPLWRLKGMVHIALGQNEEAEEALAVCLLRNPGDIDANLFSLVNSIRRDDLLFRDRILRVGETLDGVGPDLFSDMLARFTAWPDFPGYLSSLLSGWGWTGTPLDTVREFLRAYYDCRFAEAERCLALLGEKPLRPGLLPALADLLERAGGGKSPSLWVVEQGGLERKGNGLVLTGEPRSQTFAWLRMSPGWDNVDVTAIFSDVPQVAQSLYLRYLSNESYVRILLADSLLLVQERIPELGLSTIFEHRLEDSGPRVVRAVLKGERLAVYLGDVKLTATPLPVSSMIARGRLALGYENRSLGERRAVAFSLDAVRLDTFWRRLRAGTAPAELQAAMDDPAVSGVVIALEKGGQAQLSSLLAAKNSGGMTIAELPEGELDFSLVSKSVERLPALLARRIWDVVAVRPGANPDWDRVAALVDEIRGAGLRVALAISPRIQDGFAERGGGLSFDWLLLEGVDGMSRNAVRGLGSRYLEALYRTEAGDYSANAFQSLTEMAARP